MRFIIGCCQKDNSISLCQGKEVLFYSIVVIYRHFDCNLHEEGLCFRFLLFIPIRS
jgi:hypothetical protein